MAQANKINIIAGIFTGFAYESITVDNTVKSLTSSKYENSDGLAKRAIIKVEDGQLRFRYDGDVPTATEGLLLNPMDSLVLIGSDNIKNFKTIRKTSTNSKIFVIYEH